VKLKDILYVAVLWLWALARMPQLLDVTELPNKALKRTWQSNTLRRLAPR